MQIQKRTFMCSALCVVAAILAAAPHAQAGFILSIQQVGSDVVETGSGTINLSALTDGGSATSSPTNGGSLWPSCSCGSVAVAGPTGNHSLEQYSGFSGPSTFGAEGVELADSGSGDVVGILADSAIEVPSGYVSGAALSDTSTFTGEALAGLGLTTGIYTWTWGSGATADSFELDIGQSSTPEPSTFGLLALAVSGLMLGGHFRRARR